MTTNDDLFLTFHSVSTSYKLPVFDLSAYLKYTRIA
jgi:hypothetical protein